MDYFFYGILLDDDVLERVIGRAVPFRAKDRARILGFARYRAAGESYPVIVAAPAGRVAGTLVGGIRSREARRLADFEGREYRQRTVVAIGRRRGRVAARVFVPEARLRPSGQPWTLGEWRRRHKRRYLETMAGWMNAGKRAARS